MKETLLTLLPDSLSSSTRRKRIFHLWNCFQEFVLRQSIGAAPHGVINCAVSVVTSAVKSLYLQPELLVG